MDKNKREARPRIDPTAEKRLVTVVFCDLVGSTRIAEKLDAEDQSWFAIKYESLCHTSISAFGGNVERFEGDGMVACFGYPHALENGAQRAVTAALELAQAIRNTNWSTLTSDPVQARIGIDTGVVLSMDLRTDDGLTRLSALHGITLNIAKRLQEFADPDTVLVTDATLQHISEQFDTRSIGRLDSADFSNPPIAHEVTAARSVAHRVNRVHRAQLQPLVGRQDELRMLLHGWARAQLGQGTVVGVSGEPGIGKSRLLAELRQATNAGEDATIIELQCSPYHENSSYFPIIEALESEIGGENSEQAGRYSLLEKRLHEFSSPPESLPLLADLFSIPLPANTEPPTLSPEASKRRTVNALIDLLLALPKRGPLLLLIEDIQWIDPSTLDVVLNLIDRMGRTEASVLLAISSRPEFKPHETGLPEDLEMITLSPLADSDIERLVYHTGGERVWPREVLDHIVDSAAGFPLFAEELTKSLMNSDRLIDRGSHFEAVSWSPDLHVPPTLHDLLRSRLDSLGASHAVAQRAAVLGKTFSRERLAMICAFDVDDVDKHLSVLIDDGLLESDHGGKDLSFRHALMQRASYESLTRDALKEYHRRVAGVLAEEPDQMPGTRPEIAAQHFSLGEMPERAVPLWLHAAAGSIQRSANLEAIAQADRGLQTIAAMGSPSAFKEAELFLNTTKGMALIATRGWSVPEVGKTFSRAEQLSEELSASTGHSAALWGLWVYHLMRADLQSAEIYARQILDIGETTNDSKVLIEGYWTLGNTYFWQQRIDEAEHYLRKAIKLYDPSIHSNNAFIYGQDPGVSALVYLTFVSSYRGRVNDALNFGQQALALARDANHPFSSAWARGANTMLRIELNDVAGVMTHGKEALQYAMEQEQVFWIAAMQMAVGWAELRSGILSGIELAEQGMATYQATGMKIALGFFYTLIADCHLTAGNTEAAEKWVADGLEVAADDLMYRPGLLLILGALQGQRGELDQAEESFRSALNLCSEQCARLRELHAGVALAQLLHAKGQSDIAISTLRPIILSLRQAGGDAVAEHASELLASFGG